MLLLLRCILRLKFFLLQISPCIELLKLMGLVFLPTTGIVFRYRNISRS